MSFYNVTKQGKATVLALKCYFLNIELKKWKITIVSLIMENIEHSCKIFLYANAFILVKQASHAQDSLKLSKPQDSQNAGAAAQVTVQSKERLT